MKRCPTCGLTHDASHFHRNRARPDGLSAECRWCKRDRTADWKRRNPERNKEHKAAWKQRRKERT